MIFQMGFAKKQHFLSLSLSLPLSHSFSTNILNEKIFSIEEFFFQVFVTFLLSTL